jgi:metallo-beta-lactamase class B
MTKAVRIATRLCLGLAIVSAPAVRAQRDDTERRAWNVPFAPFHIIGNVHYVGAAGVSAFLIVTPEGALLLDGGLPETASQIARNIEKQGFHLKDLKYLLNSHAHFDHAGGLAELKRVSGAQMIASAGDAPMLRAGAPDMPAIVVDRVVTDGETVRLGNTTLTALVTPGHTKGCTTWTMTTTDGGKDYRVMFYCSTSVVDRLVGNAGYPQIVADYERTFARFRTLSTDVFLSNHPGFFRMEQKKRQMTSGAPNPFVDPGELQRFVATSEQDFRATLARESPSR